MLQELFKKKTPNSVFFYVQLKKGNNNMNKSPCRLCKYRTTCNDSAHCNDYQRWVKQYRDKTKDNKYENTNNTRHNKIK